MANRVHIQYFEATPIAADGARLQPHTGYGISVYDDAEEWHDGSFDSLRELLQRFPPDAILEALDDVVLAGSRGLCPGDRLCPERGLARPAGFGRIPGVPLCAFDSAGVSRPGAGCPAGAGTAWLPAIRSSFAIPAGPICTAP